MITKKRLKILDAGCGIGQNYKHFHKKGEYYGVDISKKNISYLLNKYPKKHFSVADITKGTNFHDNYFDKIYCFDVLEHVSDANSAIKELARILKRNGKIIIEVPSDFSETIFSGINNNYPKQAGHLRKLSEEKWVQIFKQNDLSLTRKKYIKFRDILYLSYKFYKNEDIISDMGEFKNKYTPDDNDKTNVLYWMLARNEKYKKIYRLLGKEFTKKKISTFGLPISKVKRFFITLDIILSRLYPKSLHMEFSPGIHSQDIVTINNKLPKLFSDNSIENKSQITLPLKLLTEIERERKLNNEHNQLVQSKFFKLWQLYNKFKKIF